MSSDSINDVTVEEIVTVSEELVSLVREFGIALPDTAAPLIAAFSLIIKDAHESECQCTVCDSIRQISSSMGIT